MSLKSVIERIVQNNYSQQDEKILFETVVKHAHWYLKKNHIDSNGLFNNYWDFALDFSARLFKRNGNNEFIYFKRCFANIANLTETQVLNKICAITFKNLKQELSDRQCELNPVRKLYHDFHRTFRYLHETYNTGLTEINIKKITELFTNRQCTKRIANIIEYYNQHQTEYENRTILTKWLVEQHLRQFKPKTIEYRTPLHDVLVKEYEQFGKTILSYVYLVINDSKRRQKTSELQAVILRQAVQNYIADCLNNQCLEAYSEYFSPFNVIYQEGYRSRFEYLTSIIRQKFDFVE